MGVGLLSKNTSIKIYRKQTHYNQWEFVFDPSQNNVGAVASTGVNGTTNGTGVNGSTGTGFGSTLGPVLVPVLGLGLGPVLGLGLV